MILTIDGYCKWMCIFTVQFCLFEAKAFSLTIYHNIFSNISQHLDQKIDKPEHIQSFYILLANYILETNGGRSSSKQQYPSFTYALVVSNISGDVWHQNHSLEFVRTSCYLWLKAFGLVFSLISGCEILFCCSCRSVSSVQPLCFDTATLFQQFGLLFSFY